MAVGPQAAALEGTSAVKTKQYVLVAGRDGEPTLVPVSKLGSASQRGTLLQAVAERGKGEDETEKLLSAVRERFDRRV